MPTLQLLRPALRLASLLLATLLLASLLLTTLALAAMAFADHAAAGQFLAIDKCRIYGFLPHSRDYALCRMNVRRFWTTGPCADPYFAAIHREYCHLNPPPFI
jgi:hypothetical protein